MVPCVEHSQCVRSQGQKNCSVPGARQTIHGAPVATWPVSFLSQIFRESGEITEKFPPRFKPKAVNPARSVSVNVPHSPLPLISTQPQAVPRPLRTETVGACFLIALR